MNDQEQEQVKQITGGKSVGAIARALLNAYDPDVILDRAKVENKADTETRIEAQIEAAQQTLIREAANLCTGELIDYLDNVRKVHEQIIDNINLDRVTFAGWNQQAKEQAASLVQDFTQFIEAHKDEITALRIFYNQPYQQRSVTYQMIREVMDILKSQKPHLAPLRVWQAYEQIEQVRSNPVNELVALVSLLRRVTGIDSTLTNYEATVNRNFQEWVFRKQAGALKFNEEQMEWLRMVKDYITTSFHLERDDLDYVPFDDRGGLGQMYELFGEEMDTIIQELNEALAA